MSIFGDYTFEADFGDGILVELCEQGALKQLTKENAKEFVELYLMHYSQLDKNQFDIVYRTMEDICGAQRLTLCPYDVMALRTCSPGEFSVNQMKAITKFNFSGSIRRNKERVQKFKKNFWTMMTEFPSKLRMAFMQFATGQNRIS